MAERLSSLEDEQIQRNATWARRFMGTAENQGAPRNRYEELQQDQNDSRRRLYKNEIDDAVARDKARTAEEFEALQIRNPAVGRLMLDREKEERAAEEGRFRRNLDVQKFEWTKEKDRIGTEINKLREQREIAQQRRLLNEALLKEKNQLRQDEQTFIAQQYIQGMADKGQMPGSPEFAYGAAEVLRQNPYIDDDYRARLVEDMQLIEDPKEAAAAAARGDRVTQTQGADGKWRYTYVRTPEKADDGKADLYKDRSYYDSRAVRIEKALNDYPEKQRGDERYKKMEAEKNEFRRLSDEADSQLRSRNKPKQSDSPPSVMGERVMVDAAATTDQAKAKKIQDLRDEVDAIEQGKKVRGGFADDEQKERYESSKRKIKELEAASAQPSEKPQYNNFTTADDFKNAYQNAEPGTVLMYNGKPYKKP